MARRSVTRSNGDLVELVLDEISNYRDVVVINIPKQPYNASFTFVRKDSGRKPWVELVTREILNIDEESLLHVSMSVYYGMAEWACAILNAKRVIGKTGAVIEVSPEPIQWSVMWRATDGDHEVARLKAVSAKQACSRGWRQWTAGNFPSITLDLMYAVPAHGTKYVRSCPERTAPINRPASTPPSTKAPSGDSGAQLSLLYGT